MLEINTRKELGCVSCAFEIVTTRSAYTGSAFSLVSGLKSVQGLSEEKSGENLLEIENCVLKLTPHGMLNEINVVQSPYLLSGEKEMFFKKKYV